MFHVLILGQTGSGKTTLAKELCNRSQRKRIVLDPMFDRWNADFQTDDAEKFLHVFWHSQSCDVFIDESGEAIGRYNMLMDRTATKGRHWGHRVHYITQRGAQLSPTLRTQCGHLFLFSMWPDDCKAMAQTFNNPDLIGASQFRQGEYMYCRRFGGVSKGNIFNERS